MLNAWNASCLLFQDINSRKFPSLEITYILIVKVLQTLNVRYIICRRYDCIDTVTISRIVHTRVWMPWQRYHGRIVTKSLSCHPCTTHTVLCRYHSIDPWKREKGNEKDRGKKRRKTENEKRRWMKEMEKKNY